MSPPSRRITRTGSTATNRQAPTRHLDPQQPSGRRTTVKTAIPQPPAPVESEPLASELASNDAMSTPAEPNAAVKLSVASPFQPEDSDAVPSAQPAPAAPVKAVTPAKAAAPAKSAPAAAKPDAPAASAKAATPSSPPSARTGQQRGSTSASGRSGTASSRASSGTSRHGKTDRRASTGGSSRVERTATGRHEAGTASSRRGPAKPKSKSGNRVLIIIAAVILLGVIAAVSWPGYQKGKCIRAMDAAKTDQSKLDAAMKASDSYLALVGNDRAAVEATVFNGHGPVLVQIHLAKAISDFHLLVSVAERESLTPEERTAALQAAADAYSPDHDAEERLPGGMDDWIADPKGSDEVAGAAIALIGKANRSDSLQALLRIAGAKLTDTTRIDAACAALAGLTNGATCGQILGLYSGPNAARAMACPALCDAVEHNCGGDLARVLALAFGEDKSVHAFALGCLGHCHLDDVAKNDDQRVDLSKRLHPLLDAKAQPDQLAGAVQACASLQLSPCMDDLIALSAAIDGMSLPDQVNGDFLAHTLGESFYLTGTPASNTLTAQLVTKLTAALAQTETRPVAAKALSLITVPTTPGLRAALDTLADVGDQASIAALKTIVAHAWSRDDVVKSAGDDSSAWKSVLAKDHASEARVTEIKAWLKSNGKYVRVSDGAERLQAAADFLEKAMADTTAWLNDANFIPPLGYAHSDIEDLHLNVKMMVKDVKPSLAGAKQDTSGQGAGGDPAPANANPASP